MNDDPQRSQSQRAGEYVLGTREDWTPDALDAERARDPALAREVAYWEGRLGVLGLALEPVAPPAAVWSGICSRTGLDAASNDPAPADTAPRPDRAARGWRAAAIAASLAALVLVGLLLAGPLDVGNPGGADPAYAAVVYDQPTGMSWLVTAPQGAGQVSVTAMGDYSVPEGKMLCAWIKPADGKPMWLGAWPATRGDHEMQVSDAAARAMASPARLMVSMEDAGFHASEPHGRIMWVSPIARHTS